MDTIDFKEKFRTPIFPIPPAFTDEFNDEEGIASHGNEVDYPSIAGYITYLEAKGARIIMSSQEDSGYNLMSFSEMLHFNRILIEEFGGTIIVQAPAYDLSTVKRFIQQLESNLSEEQSKQVIYLWQFPEDYYNDEDIVAYFKDLTAFVGKPSLFSSKPLLSAAHLHSFDYSASLINKICDDPNIIGTIMSNNYVSPGIKALEGLTDKENLVITKGEGFTNFHMLHPHGAISYVTQIGSIFPEFAFEYSESTLKGAPVDRLIMSREESCYHTLSKIGWSLGLRTALQEMGFYKPYTRRPFPNATKEQRAAIKTLVDEWATTLNIPILNE